ncbi:MAG: SRPBCC family protein [Chlamydiota bacterium]
MLIIKYTMETKAAPSQIWRVLQDVENWNSWDYGLELSRLDGPFQTGTSGYLKPKEGPLLKTLLTHVDPFKMFVQEAKLFLAKCVMTHSIDQVVGKTQVTFQTEIRGPLAFFFACLIGPSIKKKIPLEMEEMLKRVKTLG